ncbi:MAG TPA: serine hydrolase [Tahibacter sp.]|uniref:serine hydrolase domain-containing protein n=1 Tax=Tahibacter sp. TaxID=2056211 RepID=UPI002C69AAF5|nr:serine hydrolase [Tahibacter sp.]HSX61683.1 serine hydrolase [Tahibacter sp.]
MLRFVVALLFSLSAVPAAAYLPPEDLHDGWPVADAAASGWNTALFDALTVKLADKSHAGITSVLVAHRGRLLLETYANGGERARLNDMRSATKTLTALLVGAAVDRDRIAGDTAKVYAFFRGLVPARGLDARKAAMTLQDLLTMSSAWECDDENSFSSGNEERMYVSENWTAFALNLPLRGYAPWTPRPESSPYGRAFSYCTAGSFLLGAIVERATKQPLAQFAREALEQPLGIAQVQWNRSSEGVGMGGGGTRYRTRDIAKFGELLRDQGRWQGKPVIAATWIAAMLTPRAVPRENTEYGYQLWRFRFPVLGRDEWIWAMSGNGGNYVFVAPQFDLVAVVTSTAYNQRESHPRSQALFREHVLAALPAR